jgi:hypothetical protein
MTEREATLQGDPYRCEKHGLAYVAEDVPGLPGKSISECPDCRREKRAQWEAILVGIPLKGEKGEG